MVVDPNQKSIVDTCGPNGTHFAPHVPRDRKAKKKASPAVASQVETSEERPPVRTPTPPPKTKHQKMELVAFEKADKGTGALLAAWKDVTKEQKCGELCWSAIRGTIKALSDDVTPVQNAL